MPSFQKVNIGAQRFDQITRTVGFEAKQHHDRSGPTFSYDIFVFRFYEAAVRDLRQSATTGRSPARNSGHSSGRFVPKTSQTT